MKLAEEKEGLMEMGEASEDPARKEATLEVVFRMELKLAEGSPDAREFAVQILSGEKQSSGNVGSERVWAAGSSDAGIVTSMSEPEAVLGGGGQEAP